MTSYAAAGLCSCLTCLCKDCAQGCQRWLGTQRVTKIAYIILIIIFTIPTIFIFFFLNKWQLFITYFNKLITCPGNIQQGAIGCIGQSIVFRLSLSLLLLFLFLFIIMLPRTKLSMIINQGCFTFKYIFVFGLLIAFLWVDNSVFNSYAQISKYISIVYMILQSIIIIDLFYLAGIKLMRSYSQGETHYAGYLIGFTILCQGVAIGLNVLGYVYFSGKSVECQSTLWVNILTTLFIIILPIIQLLGFNLQNSLLATSLISAFISYLTFIAQFSYGDNICIRSTIPSLIADIICSTFFFILTMYGSIMGGTGQIKFSRNGDVNRVMGLTSYPVGFQQSNQQYRNPNKPSSQSQRQNLQNRQQQNLQKYAQSWQWPKWHIYMCIASIYIAMLLTNWVSIDFSTGFIKSSIFGFWVRVGIAWFSFLVYGWTMVAPRVCPSRDFYIE